jgi:glycosyltransferase involved in cell wall biosynthesis
LSEVKNIHVCLVAISLGTGGAQRVVAAHSEMFAALGYRVTVAILRDPIDYVYSGELLHLGGKNPIHNAPPRATQSWQRLWRLYRFIKVHRPDVIVDHRSRTSIFKEWVYRKLIYGKTRVIYVCHSAHAPIYLTDRPQRFGRMTAKYSEHVGVSRYITQDLMRKYGLKHRSYIPNFVSAQWLAQGDQWLAQAKTGSPIKAPYLLWFGRLDESVKDIRLLLEAFAHSTAKKQGYKLIILGSGPDALALQNRAKDLRVEPSVEFLSFDPNPQGLIKGARCVCLTSHYEGFPMALLEALSLGTPVISLDILSGPDELIHDGVNGLLVRERNSRIFGQAIDTLCLDESFYKGVKSKAQSSVAGYGADKVSQQWKELIEQAYDHD